MGDPATKAKFKFYNLEVFSKMADSQPNFGSSLNGSGFWSTDSFQKFDCGTVPSSASWNPPRSSHRSSRGPSERWHLLWLSEKMILKMIL